MDKISLIQGLDVFLLEKLQVCSTAAPTSCEEGCPLIKDASDGCLKCSCDGSMW